MMRFVGRIFEEEGSIRGSVNFIADEAGASERIRYFKSFDDLKKILEEEYAAKKQQKK